MWFDEAFWADRILQGDAWFDPKRPPGYVGLVWLLGHVYGAEWPFDS